MSESCATVKSDEKQCDAGSSLQNQFSSLLLALERQADLITRLIEVQFAMTAAIGDLLSNDENEEDARSGMGAGRGGVIR